MSLEWDRLQRTGLSVWSCFCLHISENEGKMLDKSQIQLSSLEAGSTSTPFLVSCWTKDELTTSWLFFKEELRKWTRSIIQNEAGRCETYRGTVGQSRGGQSIYWGLDVSFSYRQFITSLLIWEICAGVSPFLHPFLLSIFSDHLEFPIESSLTFSYSVSDLL